MSYLLNKTDGTLLINLVDGTADGPQINLGLNASDVNLIGKNYPAYGEVQNENFLHLLENFANNIPPSKPIAGEIWYDTTTSPGTLRVFDGTVWRTVAAVSRAATAPSSPSNGDQWWDTVNNQFKIWDGTEWVLIGPAYSTVTGKTGTIVESITDTLAALHLVVKVYIANVVVAVISNDATFTPAVAITGFSTITPGINLSATTLVNGTATNSLQLGNVVATSYARLDTDSNFVANISVGGGHVNFTSVTGSTSLVNAIVNSSTNFYVNVGGTSTKALAIDGATGEVQVTSSPVTSTGVATKGYVDATAALLAPLASPVLSGIPTAPTPAVSDNSQQIATTAFAQSLITNDALWKGSNKYVSTVAPTALEGAVGDFWFQVNP